MAEIRDAVQDIRTEFDLNRQEHELKRREHELNREAYARLFDQIRRETENSRAVMRELVAEIHTMREEGRRHSEAVVGALTDLAAEIRGWGGGAAPAG